MPNHSKQFDKIKSLVKDAQNSSKFIAKLSLRNKIKGFLTEIDFRIQCLQENIQHEQNSVKIKSNKPTMHQFANQNSAGHDLKSVRPYQYPTHASVSPSNEIKWGNVKDGVVTWEEQVNVPLSKAEDRQHSSMEWECSAELTNSS